MTRIEDKNRGQGRSHANPLGAEEVETSGRLEDEQEGFLLTEAR